MIIGHRPRHPLCTVQYAHASTRGNVIARKAHVGLNMGMLTLFLWQAVSGMEIVNKIWTNR